MCGIAGISCLNQDYPVGDTAANMAQALVHRGPDGVGVWVDRRRSLAMSHRRLAIIDLSVSANQPMHYAGGRFTLVFNGEIYNYRELRADLLAKGHRFETEGDSEVLLASYMEWGGACLSRLNGMFAIAIYDRDKDTIFMARDRAGEKPLYYAHIGGAFIFGSELKALMACPLFERRLDLAAMEFFMAYGYVPGEMCIFQGASKLQPGHALRYNRRDNTIQIWPYWKLPETEVASVTDDLALIEELEHLLTDAVKRQLVADVPVGVLLSGGLDSSLVTALAAQASNRRIKTFTVSFPGHAEFDESGHARLVAEHFGTDHTVLTADTASVDLLPTLARQYDEPLGDSSMIPTYLVSRLIRQHATVAVGGDGGDELFGGYHHYNWLLKHASIRRTMPGVIGRLLSAGAQRCLPVGFRGRSYLLGLGGTAGQALSCINQFFDVRVRGDLFPALLASSVAKRTRPEHYKGLLVSQDMGIVEGATTVDFLTYLPDDILTKVDRASMLASLEVRAPFLDYRIIEFAFARVPASLKTTSQSRKILLKLLGRKLLPEALDLNRKQGFAVPLPLWFKGEWGTYMREVLLSTDCVFERKQMSTLLGHQQRGLSNTQRIFALTMFELWRREYNVSC